MRLSMSRYRQENFPVRCSFMGATPARRQQHLLNFPKPSFIRRLVGNDPSLIELRKFNTFALRSLKCSLD